ncbi:MAG TPA: hypothetical protein VFX76_09520, partial [Roseiflexaceae bacterium]|nr:hypothetical protein [Roseiflexaceae bacterium]
MPDYQPLDLGALCNAGADVYGSNTPPIGNTTFHGLPFLVGGASPDTTRCLIDLGTVQESIRVLIGASARHVIFAHALL